MEALIVNGKKYFKIKHVTTLETGSACKHCVADADADLCEELSRRDCVGYRFEKGDDYMQVGGTHYASMKIQPFEIMKANFKEAEYEGFLRGNVLKYLLRYQDKNGVEDLKKAEHYLKELIAYLEV